MEFLEIMRNQKNQIKEIIKRKKKEIKKKSTKIKEKSMIFLQLTIFNQKDIREIKESKKIRRNR